jgi:hypothetical protein
VSKLTLVGDYWTIVHDKTRHPVIPFDCNPGSADEGMLVYRSRRAASAACGHQRQLYGVKCHAVKLGQEAPAASGEGGGE